MTETTKEPEEALILTALEKVMLRVASVLVLLIIGPLFAIALIMIGLLFPCLCVVGMVRVVFGLEDERIWKTYIREDDNHSQPIEESEEP